MRLRGTRDPSDRVSSDAVQQRGAQARSAWWDGERDARYTLTTLLRCGKEAIVLSGMRCLTTPTLTASGLFLISGGNDPRPRSGRAQGCVTCADGIMAASLHTRIDRHRDHRPYARDGL